MNSSLSNTPEINQQIDLTIGSSINGSIYSNATLIQTIDVGEPSFFSQYKYIIILAFVVVFFLLRILRKKNKAQRNVIYLVGQRNSGKTQLIYYLSKGIKTQTVPSIKNNSTLYSLNERKTVQLIDVAGSNHTKQEFVANIDRSLAIVQVVDGTNSESLLGTAELLYRILISKSYQKSPPNHIIFLNKSDSLSFLGQKMFQKKLEDEMERIKLSRRTMIEQRQGEQDNIKSEKARWSLSDYDIKVVKGSVANQELSALEEVLQN